MTLLGEGQVARDDLDNLVRAPRATITLWAREVGGVTRRAIDLAVAIAVLAGG